MYSMLVSLSGPMFISLTLLMFTRTINLLSWAISWYFLLMFLSQIEWQVSIIFSFVMVLVRCKTLIFRSIRLSSCLIFVSGHLLSVLILYFSPEFLYSVDRLHSLHACINRGMNLLCFTTHAQMDLFIVFISTFSFDSFSNSIRFFFLASIDTFHLSCNFHTL